MNLFFDTNIFVSDFRMKGNAFRIFLSSVGRIGVNVYIPQIVYDEVLNKYKEELDDVASKYENCKKNGLN